MSFLESVFSGVLFLENVFLKNVFLEIAVDPFVCVSV